MKKVLFAIILLVPGARAQSINEEIPLDARPSFERVSDHCYFLNIEENGENIAVVATGQGTLLFDPPPEPDLSVLIDSLRNLNAGAVRWMINTGSYLLQTAGVEYFSGQGAVLLTGFLRHERLSIMGAPYESVPASGSNLYGNATDSTAPASGFEENVPAYPGTPERGSAVFPRFTFKRRMYLYPDNLEIEIRALQHEARTGADIVAYVPNEKVLFVGRLYDPSNYPDIDVSTGGSALKWIDALGQVIDSVPLLISAIPPEEPEAVEDGGGEIEAGMEKVEAQKEKEGEAGEGEVSGEEEEEITPEEMVAVIPARGEISNLLKMKEMLEISRKLQRGISRTVKAGRPCENYLDSPEAAPFRIYGNYFPYAEQLCRELSPKPAGGGQ